MVLQLLAATEKTGELEVRGDGDAQRGFLGVSGGRLVSARSDDEEGFLALGAVFAIESGDFEFLPQDRVERTDLSGGLEELLDRAVVERERIRSIREVIPTDRMRFRLSERATERGEITLAPQQWRALLLVDGRRNVTALARDLQMGRLAAEQLLAALVRAGLVDPFTPEGDEDEGPHGYRRLPPMQEIPPTASGEPIVLRGRLPDFPLETILQLLAETKKTGRLEVRAGRDSSTLGMSEGRLVSARGDDEEGELGLGAAFTAQEGDFEFVPMSEAPAADLSGSLDALLDRAAETRDRIVGIRRLIPDERATFTLSERATMRSEIVLTPEQWRVLLGVNGERDVLAIAQHLRMRPLPAMMVLADLVRGGYVDVVPAEQTWPYVERRKTPWAVAAAAIPAVEAETPSEGPAVAPAEAAPSPSPWEAAAAPEAPVLEEPAAEAEEELHEEAAVEGELAEEEEEEPLAETPLDHEPDEDDRLAAIEGVVGPAEPAPPPAAWDVPTEIVSPEAAAAEATAEAFEEAVDPRLAAFGAPPAEVPAPSWEAPPAEPRAEPAWETPQWETPAPAEEAPAEIDPRLAAFGTPVAQPEAPPAEAAPPPPPPPIRADTFAPSVAPTPAAPAVPEKKKGLFGGLFGGGAKAAPAPAPFVRSGSRAGQLASFANELIAAYNSGQYGKARVEDRMLSLIMRADEQADPIDRPLPIVDDRLDIGAIEHNGLPERQALPYLAVLLRQIYDEAERVLGKDKARRGFRDVRDRLFGKDLALFQVPEVSGRLPKV